MIALEEPTLSRDQEFLFTNIKFCYFDVANREDIFNQNITSGAKKFCKLRDIGLSELNVFSKILTYS